MRVHSKLEEYVYIKEVNLIHFLVFQSFLYVFIIFSGILDNTNINFEYTTYNYTMLFKVKLLQCSVFTYICMYNFLILFKCKNLISTSNLRNREGKLIECSLSNSDVNMGNFIFHLENNVICIYMNLRVEEVSKLFINEWFLFQVYCLSLYVFRNYETVE